MADDTLKDRTDDSIIDKVGNHEEVHQLQPHPSHKKHLYDKATSPVLFYGSIEDWF